MEYSGEGNIPKQIRVLVRRKTWERMLRTTELSVVTYVILIANKFEKVCLFIVDQSSKKEVILFGQRE